ncbi:hypothetical protein QJS10_CPB11g00837 [Acorus calamus]|uniref:Uncharacterized protein n=1 Tax=Acorus calamus TaxID=4465 RepID=A0AAV9DW48_ACOCL|nr:hypothetical protein QJS10_CPB11g00837 [Acorus calamus]
MPDGEQHPTISKIQYQEGGKQGKGKRPIDPNKVKAVWDNAKHEVFIRICLDEMRMGNKPVAAKGDDSWVPTSGSSARGKRSFGWSDSTTAEDQEDYQFTEHQPYSTPTPSSVPPTSNVPDEATSPRRQSPLPPLPVAPKRQRTAVGQRLGGSIDRMCDILEMRTNLAYGNDTVPKFADAMALVDRIPEIPVDSPVYFYALDMLRDPGNRELVSYCREASSARKSFCYPTFTTMASRNTVQRMDTDEDAELEINLIIMVLLERLIAYEASYLNKQPVHDQTYTGNQKVFDMLHGHWRVCFDTCRVMPEVFIKLCKLLRDKGLASEGLEGESNTSRAVPQTSVKCRLSVMLYVMRSQRRMRMLGGESKLTNRRSNGFVDPQILVDKNVPQISIPKSREGQGSRRRELIRWPLDAYMRWTYISDDDRSRNRRRMTCRDNFVTGANRLPGQRRRWIRAAGSVAGGGDEERVR